MHGEDLFVDDCRNGQAVEAICECFPKLNVVSALALIVKAIDSVNRCTFVVTSEDEEVLRVLDLVCKEEADGL